MNTIFICVLYSLKLQKNEFSWCCLVCTRFLITEFLLSFIYFLARHCCCNTLYWCTAVLLTFFFLVWFPIPCLSLSPTLFLHFIVDLEVFLSFKHWFKSLTYWVQFCANTNLSYKIASTLSVLCKTWILSAFWTHSQMEHLPLFAVAFSPSSLFHS